MEFIIYVIICFIILGLFIILLNRHSNNGKIQHTIEAEYIEGVENVIGQYKCTVTTLDNNLLIDIKKNKLKIELPYNKIISIGSKEEKHQEIVTTNKSPISRSIVGGALFGSTGAIVGGLSGLNSKTQSETVVEDYIHIKYMSTNKSEKTIILKAYCPRINKIC